MEEIGSRKEAKNMSRTNTHHTLSFVYYQFLTVWNRRDACTDSVDQGHWGKWDMGATLLLITSIGHQYRLSIGLACGLFYLFNPHSVCLNSCQHLKFYSTNIYWACYWHYFRSLRFIKESKQTKLPSWNLHSSRERQRINNNIINN